MTSTLPRIGFVSFYVLDLQRSLSFYVEQLGMREVGRIPLPGGILEVLLAFGDGAGVMLMHDPRRTTPYERGDGFSRFTINVAEVRPLIQRLEAGGVQVVVPPRVVEQLKLTYALVRDPDGYTIEFIER